MYVCVMVNHYKKVDRMGWQLGEGRWIWLVIMRFYVAKVGYYENIDAYGWLLGDYSMYSGGGCQILEGR